MVDIRPIGREIGPAAPSRRVRKPGGGNSGNRDQRQRSPSDPVDAAPEAESEERTDGAPADRRADEGPGEAPPAHRIDIVV
ncbi:MAG: hypothetical protein ACOWWM_06030 [Desulfobacterales bacterium]